MSGVIMENVHVVWWCRKCHVIIITKIAIFNVTWKSVYAIYTYIRVKVTSRNIVEPRIFLFSSERIPFVSSDFGRTRRTSLVEIVKVSRDTMNYSCRGDAKLRETFLRRGESLLVYVNVYVCMCTHEACGVLVCRHRGGWRRVKKGQIEEWMRESIGSSSRPEATL